jgi:hypothetical protein
MKKKITLLLLLVLTTVLSAQTVNIQGDPYTGNPYATITDAITASSDGDVILITGVHTEPIGVQKSITLRGTDPTIDIIEAAVAPLSDASGDNVISISRDTGFTGDLTITIENLGVRHGNANSNGGGVTSDKVTGLLTLKNLIIEDNYTSKNGGGVSVAGSNVDIIECTIKDNTSALDGGAIIAAPNNGVTVDNTVNIKQSLINSNSGRNGGALYINGNNGFGNSHVINVTIENSTIANNTATSGSGGVGAGAIFSKVAVWTGDGATGNITLSLIHATIYNNTHASAGKNGLIFSGSTGILTNFSAYNSIIVSADNIAQKVLNFAKTNTTNVVNCILGGLNTVPTSIVDDVAKNNQKGKTATQAGLSGTLTSEGGSTQVIAISESSSADDFCSAATGITLPTLDQRGYTRVSFADAGAYEIDASLGTSDVTLNSIVKIYPNPAQDFVTIEGVQNIEFIKIYSVTGTLEKTVYGKSSLDVSDLSSGLHFLVIKSGTKTTSSRILIK